MVTALRERRISALMLLSTLALAVASAPAARAATSLVAPKTCGCQHDEHDRGPAKQRPPCHGSRRSPAAKRLPCHQSSMAAARKRPPCHGAARASDVTESRAGRCRCTVETSIASKTCGCGKHSASFGVAADKSIPSPRERSRVPRDDDSHDATPAGAGARGADPPDDPPPILVS